MVFLVLGLLLSTLFSSLGRVVPPPPLAGRGDGSEVAIRAVEGFVVDFAVAASIRSRFRLPFCGPSSIFCGHRGDRGHAHHHHQSLALGIGADALGELYWLPD